MCWGKYWYQDTAGNRNAAGHYKLPWAGIAAAVRAAGAGHLESRAQLVHGVMGAAIA
jgi:hypothetical protein